MHWCNQPVDMRLLGKNLVATLFLLAFFMQTFHKSYIIADYYADTSFYEANCENKAKPELQCHGKCQVVNELAKQEKKDQQNPERRAENRQEIVCLNAMVENIDPTGFEITIAAKISPRKTGEPADQNFDFFHPPQA